jgi:hypothetical protein
VAHGNAFAQTAQVSGWDQPDGGEAAAGFVPQDVAEHEVPRIESPPLAHDAAPAEDWIAQVRDDAQSRATQAHRTTSRRFAFGSGPAGSLRVNPPMAVAAMAALVLALIIWRNDVVRLLPQTATFFQLTGLSVNLRSLAFEDVRVSTEAVNGSKVFVIEGTIAPTSRKAVEIPRLRFVLQDAQGTDIYAWNSIVDQAVIKPGEKVAFKSHLASPPADAHSVVVRFFNRRDLASGSV